MRWSRPKKPDKRSISLRATSRLSWVSVQPATALRSWKMVRELGPMKTFFPVFLSVTTIIRSDGLALDGAGSGPPARESLCQSLTLCNSSNPSIILLRVFGVGFQEYEVGLDDRLDLIAVGLGEAGQPL